MLLNNNAFSRYRVDLIPNNLITYKEINDQKREDIRQYIQNVTKGKAKMAMDLIKFNPNVERSIRYAFQDVIVCEDSETAKKLAYDPYLNMKTVTVEGDIYHPTGVLTGGYTSQAKDGMALRKVKELMRLEDELKYTKGKLTEVCKEIQALKFKAQEYHDKKAEIELNEH